MSLFKDMEIKLIAGFNIQANHCEIFSDILNMLFFLDFGPAQKLHLFKSWFMFKYSICSETILTLQARFYSWLHVE